MNPSPPTPPPSEAQERNAAGQPIHRCGTLTYTRLGLIQLFGWLLWGDFCYQLFEHHGGPGILALYLQDNFHVSNTTIAILMITIPKILGTIMTPIISFHSDRCRSRWGRRIPYMLFTAPFLALFAVALGFSDDIFTYFKTHLDENSAISPMTASMTVIGFFIIGFSFFNEFVGTVYWYIFADVVPRKFIGRFSSLFNIVTQIAGFIAGVTIAPYVISHMKAIHIGVALIYLIGFGLMCWKVKEGTYPPVQDVTAESTFMDKVKLYFRECFSHRIYIYVYLTIAVSSLGVGLRIQEIFPLHISKHQAGTAMHPGGAQAVAMTPNGTMAVTAGSDGTVRRWQIADGGRTMMAGPASEPAAAPRTCVAVCRDGRLIAEGGSDGSIVLRDGATLQPTATLAGHAGGVHGLAFSPDGTLVASAGADGAIRLWRSADGAPLQVLSGHQGAVRSVAFDRGGSRLVSGGADGAVLLWNAADGTLIREVARHPGPVNAVCFMPGLGAPPEVPAGQAPGLVERTGSWLSWYITYAFTNESLYDTPADQRSLASHDDRWIAAGGRDGEKDEQPALLRIWNAEDGASIGELKGHKKAITSVAFKPDLRFLLSGSFDETIRMWDPAEFVRPATADPTAKPDLWTRAVRALGLSAKTDQTLRSYSGYTHGVTGIACAEHQPLMLNASDRMVDEPLGKARTECTGMLHAWNLDQGISLMKRAIAGSFWGLITILISYPMGMLVDRYNPLRVKIVLSALLIPFQVASFWLMTDYFSSMWLNVVRIPFTTMLSIIFLPYLIMIFPASKFGQFSSARALLSQGIAAAAVPAGAVLMDVVTSFTYDTDAFRWVFIYQGVLSLLTLIPCVLVYREWKRLGGERYVAPDLEPGKPA